MTEIKVFGYHFPCIDGHMAKICKNYYDSLMGDSGDIWFEWRFNPSAQIAGMKKLFKVCNDKKYIISEFVAFDVAFDVPAVQLLLDQNPNTKVFLFDHHKTSEEAFANFNDPRVKTVHDMNECGATLAWKHYFPGIELPLFLKHVRIRDNWEYSSEEAKELHSYEVNNYLFATQPDYKDKEAWFKYLTIENEAEFNEMAYQAGKCLGLTEDKMVRIIQTGGSIHKINEHYVFVCNTSCYQSELGNKMAHFKDEKGRMCDYVMMWRYNEACNKYCVSLRSRKSGTDVSQIAQRYGGGGHAAAAGFTIENISDILPWLSPPTYTQIYVYPVISYITNSIQKIMEFPYRIWNFTFQRIDHDFNKSD